MSNEESTNRATTGLSRGRNGTFLGYQSVNVTLEHDQDDLVNWWEFPGDTGARRLFRTSFERIRQWIDACSAWGIKTRSTFTPPEVLQTVQSESPSDAHETGENSASHGEEHRAKPFRKPRTLKEFLDELGSDFFDILFSEDVRRDWRDHFGQAMPRPIRLRFEMDSNATRQLASLPLEVIRSPGPGELDGVPEDFVLAKRISIVRRISHSLRQKALTVDGPVRLLVFVSNPSSLRKEYQLDAKAEVDAINAIVKELGPRLIALKVVESPGASFQRIQEVEKDFHVFHFIGHGGVLDGEAKILLDDDLKGMEWRRISDVAQVLQSSSVRLVLLNGCQTAAISEFACLFPAVVGMQFRITDESAVRFAKGFYRELADTGQLDDAVWKGRQGIWAGSEATQWEYRTPVLYMESNDGVLLHITPRILTESLHEGEQHAFYKYQVEAKGGRRPFSWSAENLPLGLSINIGSGIIDGRPGVSGEFNVSIRVSSVDQLTSESTFRLTIHGENVKILTERIG